MTENKKSSTEEETKDPQAARKQALIVLEVLAGTRSTQEASEELSISTNSYYQLEERAISGLIDGCKPKPRGPTKDANKEIRTLKKEREMLINECTRYQALLRTSQLTVGIDPDDGNQKSKRSTGRKRKPMIRALRAIDKLSEDTKTTPTES